MLLLLTSSQIPSPVISKHVTTNILVNNSYLKTRQSSDEAVKCLSITDLLEETQRVRAIQTRRRREIERQSQQRRNRRKQRKKRFRCLPLLAGVTFKNHGFMKILRFKKKSPTSAFLK